MKMALHLFLALLCTGCATSPATRPATSADPIIKTEITQKPDPHWHGNGFGPSNDTPGNPNSKLVTTTITRPSQHADILIRQLQYEDVAAAADLLRDMLGITAQIVPESNTIIVTGDTDRLLLARSIIEKIDINPALDESVTFIYHVKNADAQQLAATMQQVFDKALDATDRARGYRPYVIVDARTHSLLMGAPLKYVKDFAKILAELDQPLPTPATNPAH